MKKYLILFFIAAVAWPTVKSAQSIDEDWDYLLVREDIVHPSQTNMYEAALSDLLAYLEEKKANDVSYITQLQDDYHYSHIIEIQNFEEVLEGFKEYVSRKYGSDLLDLIWQDLEEAIKARYSYIVKYVPEYSSVPDGNLWLENKPYRRWNYYYLKPGAEKEVDRLLGAWKSLYERKGAKHGYRVYRGVIGIEDPVVIFTTWAETPLEYQNNLQENIDLLGDEGTQLWTLMLDLSRKVATQEGWYLPQYSYRPGR